MQTHWIRKVTLRVRLSWKVDWYESTPIFTPSSLLNRLLWLTLFERTPSLKASTTARIQPSLSNPLIQTRHWVLKKHQHSHCSKHRIHSIMELYLKSRSKHWSIVIGKSHVHLDSSSIKLTCRSSRDISAISVNLLSRLTICQWQTSQEVSRSRAHFER